MKLYFITISFFALLSTSIVYAEENINNNTNIQQNSTSTATNKVMGYKFEPFLLLDGEKFEDISHDDTFVLQNFAITAWINTNQSTLLEPAHIVNKGGFNTDEKGENMNYGIWFSVDGTISGGFETESGEDFEVKSTAKYNDGKWHYVLLSYDGSLLRLDIDGKKHVSTTKNINIIPDTTGDQPLRIGANSLDESKFFTGNIDEVRVWNRGLTDEEISEIYTNNIFDSNGQIIYLDFGGDGDNFSSQSLTQKIIDKKDGIEQGEGPSSDITNTIKDFNIAVSADWGCEEDTVKTTKNIQKKSPDLVIAAGDLSYEESADCWFEIMKPFVSKMKIAMGDHEYSDTSGGAIGIIDQYLNPLNLAKTYYSFDLNNVHVTVIDPYIDYKPGSSQYQFIETELKTASTNPKIDWTFVVESIPIYTSPAQHPGNSTIRDIYHPLFDKYGVDLVFTSDNHNYQRTFPLKYNSEGGSYSSDSPIISNSDKNNYNADSGVIYLITGTAGRSLYEIKEQAPFVAKQEDKHFGFLNIDISDNTLKGTFYANESELPRYYYVNYQSNIIIDHFTISKTNIPKNNEFNKL